MSFVTQDDVFEAIEPVLSGVFEEFAEDDLLDTLDRALELFAKDPAAWKALRARGMKQDWSWPKSARAYVDLFARAKKKAPKG